MIDAKKVLLDTNVLLSPLTFLLLYKMQQNNWIDLYISDVIWKEYEFHKEKINNSLLKNQNEKIINGLLSKNIKTINYKSDILQFKVKDKGDKHLLQFAYFHQISIILSFDNNAFYKSQLKKLSITHIHPDKFILENFKNFNLQGVEVLTELDGSTEEFTIALKNAQLKKLAKSIQ